MRFDEERAAEAGGAGVEPQSPRAEKPSLEQSGPEQPGLVRTAMLVAGSALFGGLAVALWHRRTLAKIRQEVGTAAPSAEPPEEGSTLD